ncbi:MULTISPECIES: NAD(P)-dependent oxidoreductase [unclassified Nocardiopsis]|uniref:NAD(P)-dependent oxidoreductase n=1 Tax=Nocardiopsis TaxID=2013 RepID=UPI00387AFD43
MQDHATPMRIGVIGATTGIGALIAAEARHRGHDVCDIRRNPLELDYGDLDGLDVLVNAHQAQVGRERDHLEVDRHLISLLTGTSVRLLVAGSPGHLYADESRTATYWQSRMARGPLRDLARSLERAYFLYQISLDLRWTYLAPPVELVREGERTGRYRTGGDVVLTDEHGRSRISDADYAVALVDEIETDAHSGRLYTVAA